MSKKTVYPISAKDRSSIIHPTKQKSKPTVYPISAKVTLQSSLHHIKRGQYFCQIQYHKFLTMKVQFCQQCQDVKAYDVKEHNVEGLGYHILSCPDCHSTLAKCMLCPRSYSVRKYDHRNIKNI